MTESSVSVFVCPKCGFMTTRLPDRKQHETECNTKMDLKTLSVKRFSSFVTLEIEGKLKIDVFL